ncbi:C2 domain-containing protein At1g53590-like isoform X1 [Glycine soja]|nr:C2 domain-containing protein At1g53590 [Glycine max]XP_028203152.1 C2 domain-containing protein At1g53590-like isoform X1 [Glycine soja]|eukprot:XP_025981409.1 C2 domain-containing protein At1g53590 isoform X1 [Glycine max]
MHFACYQGMNLMEVSILHHVGIVLVGLWILSAFNWCHTVAYFVALIYLFLVHERYVTRLRRKLQFEEWKQANQRRVLSDSETVRWLNHAVENIWPICMEQITSQKILFPIIPWFLEKYKPWTAKEAVVQHLYLGRNPPLITEVRVLRQSDDDHLVLELGLNFLTADDMSAILAVKLRKRLGFGMWAKLHITGMHVEGKVLVGVKFLPTWPFIGRLRVCFVEPPYFQMTVKPLFTHGLDMTELPGIAGWLDKLLSIAFEQTLVEPNMLVVDVEKFVSPQQESWFKVDEKEPVAYAKVEVIEASDMKPSDLNGLADPYVKGQMGVYRFRTKIQRKTLTPKWHEEFKIPIITWESDNVLVIAVRDKDHFYDDILGDCSVNINEFRDGQRHDMWLSLKNIKMGSLHLAITILEDNGKGVDTTCEQEPMDFEEPKNSFEANETTDNSSFSPVPPEKSEKLADNYEPIDIKGQQETGVWVHHPGSEVSQRWEPRKGKSRRLDTEIHGEPNDSVGSGNSTVSGSLNNDSSSPDNNHEEKHRMRLVRKGLHKIGSVFHRSPVGEELLSPHDNISSFQTGKVQAEGGSTEGSSPESPASAKGNVKDMAKNILKHAEKSARGLRHVLSCKSRKFKDESPTVPEIEHESDSSDQESVAAQSPIDVIRTPVGSPAVVSGSNGSPNSGVNVVQIVPSNTNVDNQATTEIANEKDDPENTCSSDRYREEFVKSAELEHDKEEMGADKKDSISLSQ